MTGLVFGLSGLLVLIGAVSVISGAPIIQIERGWAEVIAGSVAVSGGVVAFALGVVLVRLKAMHKALVALSVPVLQQKSVDVPPSVEPVPIEVIRSVDPDEPVLRPTRAPDDDVAIQGSEPLRASLEGSAGEIHPASPSSETRTSLWKRVSRPARPVPVVDQKPAAAVVPDAPEKGDQRSPPDLRVEASEPANAPTSFEAPSLDVASPARDEDFSSPRRLVTPPTPVVEDSQRPARTGASARDWLTQPLLRSRSAKTPVSEPLPPLFDSPPERAENEALASVRDEPAANAEGRSVDQDLEEAERGSEASAAPAESEELTVIGRYQAGASSYTMYSDGAIDVETEAGDIHRFGSMDELKAFIARQESALS